MEQRDYIILQIEQLGRVLTKLLSELSGIKTKGKVSAGIEITNQVLKNELDLDITDILNCPTDLLVKKLQAKKNFNNENMEKLAEILLLIADSCKNESDYIEKSIIFYEKSLSLYEYLEKVELTYSISKHLKIDLIKEKILQA